MPPTRAAAMNTASGRASAIQAWVASCRRRSSRSLSVVRTSQASRARRLTSAEPTMPRWPATQTRLPASGKAGSVDIAAWFGRHGDQALGHHIGAEVAPAGLVAPAQLGAGLGRIALEQVHFGWAEVARIDLDQHTPGLGVDA